MNDEVQDHDTELITLQEKYFRWANKRAAWATKLSNPQLLAPLIRPLFYGISGVPGACKFKIGRNSAYVSQIPFDVQLQTQSVA